jgi:quinoprotein relay system zinc metallohydrolase 2
MWYFMSFKSMRYSLVFLLLLAQPVLAITALPVKQVAAGIYVHFGIHELPNKNNHGAIANIGFIVGNRCVAVIDTGGNPEQGLALKKAINRITPLPVCYVINTHVHPDHIYGNKAFKQPGVKFVGHHKLARAMSMRGAYYLDKAADQIAVKLTAADLIPPDLPVTNVMQLDLGGRMITLTAHPTAHTDNDLSIYDQQTDTLWLSDLLFIQHIPVVDGSLKGWIKELEQLQKRKFKQVIPGHGPVVKTWPGGMQAELDYLRLLLQEIRVAIKQGVYMEDAMNNVGYSARKQWQLFDQFHKKNISTAFAELEWED